MDLFTGYEYLLIDAANQFGKDKLVFADRIQWTKDHMDRLEALVDSVAVKERPLFVKALYAIRDAQAHKPTGHVAGLDATASGLQILACVTGCKQTALMVNLIDPTVRKDAYTDGTLYMNTLLPADSQITLDGSGYLTREDVKNAIMTVFYGSTRQPKNHFGEDTLELQAFYDMVQTLFPGAFQTMQLLLQHWNPYTLQHIWELPDFHTAHVRVMQTVDARIEVDELDHTTFTHRIEVNQGTEYGLSIPANVTHSIDGMVVREMHRRCNYNHGKLMMALAMLDNYLGITAYKPKSLTKFVSLAAVEKILKGEMFNFDVDYLQRLRLLIKEVIQYRAFGIITIHDEFKAGPNNLNRMRYWYKEILAELADSNILEDILRQLSNNPRYVFHKYSKDLSKYIRESNYALC